MKKILLLPLFLVCFGMSISSATTVLGADISYKNINADKYEVTIKFYRDCTGVNVGNIAGTIRAGTNTVSFTPTKVGIVDETPTCPTSISACASQQSGLGIGTEVHIFKDTIDLGLAPYTTWINNGECEFFFEYTQCCRNQDITNINNGNFYNYAMLNICNVKKMVKKNNSSPEYSNDLINYFCCNNPAFYNSGATDTFDYDSLSYALVAPMSNYNTNMAYKSPFDAMHPMTPKCLKPGTVNCKPVPNANPPLGFFLDPIKGDVIFNPSKCDETGIVVVELKEWRKDQNGKALHIGTTRRDLQFVVMNCGNNFPPKIKSSKYDYTICEGEKIKIDFNATDIPHPSNPNGKKDTVTLSWNGALINNGSFTTTNDTNNRDKIGSFEWQTKIGDVQDAPYTFTVNAQDDACPLMAKTSRSFSIKVLPKAKILSKTFSTFCDKITVEAVPDNKSIGPFTYNWTLYDSASPNVVVDTKTSSKDTLTVNSESTYYVKLVLTNGLNCPSTFLDTIRFTPKLNTLNLGNDTTYGFQNNIQLDAGSGFTNYVWSDNSTASTLVIYPVSLGIGTYNYSVEVTNSNGCKYNDDINITIDGCKNNLAPTISSSKDTFDLCVGEKLDFTFDVKDATSTDYVRIDNCDIEYLNSYGSFSYQDSTTKNKTGVFSWQTSESDASSTGYNLSFKYYDDACPSTPQYKTFVVNVNPLPKASLASYLSCETYIMKANLDANFALPAIYYWEVTDSVSNTIVFNSSLPTTSYTIPKESTYKVNLILENKHGCFTELKESKVLKPFKNRDLLGADRLLFIRDSLILKPATFALYNWSDGSSGDRLKVLGSTLGLGKTMIKLNTTDNIGCDYYDSVIIDVKCSPSTLDIGGNQTVDIWEKITLSSNNDYSTYLWDDNTSTKSNEIEARLLGVGVHKISLNTTDEYNCLYNDDMLLTVTDVTSIDEANIEKIKVYPTPTKDILQIELPQDFKAGKIEIIDLLGKIVLRKELGNVNKEIFGLNVSQLPKGAYILKLKDLNKEYRAKIVKK